MTWSIARRVTTSACGAIVAIAAAILGLTEIAGGGTLYRAGVAIMVASFTTALVAFYVACSGLWAGWAGALIGPAAALSFFLLASMCVALIGAAVMAWALRSPERVGSGVTLSA